MAVRKIVTLPEPILRRKAKKVTRFNAELKTLIDDMVETMREAPGVGLAAPQVGVPERVIVVEFHEDEEDEESPLRLYTVVNPQIVQESEETVLGVEGCLSVPALVGEVERHLQVVVKAQDLHGKPLKLQLTGWIARIFQHEIDHLDGVMFTDRATKVWKPSEEETIYAD